MNQVSFILAQLDPKDLGSYWQHANVSKAGLGTVISAISAVIVLVLVWAIFIRKPGRDRPRRYDYPSLSTAESPKSARNGSSGGHARRKRRRRREHRPRKPTLSETGGLPPVRNDVPSDDPP
jgi:hypothetical protein